MFVVMVGRERVYGDDIIRTIGPFKEKAAAEKYARAFSTLLWQRNKHHLSAWVRRLHSPGRPTVHWGW